MIRKLSLRLFALLICTGSFSSGLYAQGGRYVASRKGMVYYWSTCAAASRLSPSNRIYFSTSEEARVAGYKPSKARGCAGPEYDAMISAAQAVGERCVIEKVIDGDTIHCSHFGSIRLLLIDAPELQQGPYGVIAKAEAERLLPIGDSVSLEFDLVRRDKYARVLAYVFKRNGSMVNRELARRGVAVISIYQPNIRYVDLIRSAADSAYAEKLQLWSGSAFNCLPGDFRAGKCH